MIYRFQVRGRIYEIRLERNADKFRAWIDGASYDVEVLDSQPGVISLRFAGRPVTAHFAAGGRQKWVSCRGCTYLFETPEAASRSGGDRTADTTLRSPMPARVRSVEVAPGETVEKGRTLLLLEAMKMEIRLQAPRAGTVTVIRVSPGQTVNRDQDLIEIQ